MNAAPGRPQAEVHDVWQRPFVRMHRTWCDDFILELRLRDVPGATIGDHLAEVESHCIETGQDPQEAFGDPTGYARDIGAQDRSGPDPGVLRVTILSLVGLVVFLTGSDAMARWAQSESLAYNAAEIIATILLLAGLAGVPWLMGPLLRRRSFGLSYLTGLLALGVLRALTGLLPLDPVLRDVPAAPVALGGFVLVCLIATLEDRELAEEDRVVSPLPTAPSRRRTPSALARTAAWIFPALYLLLGAIIWLAA